MAMETSSEYEGKLGGTKSPVRELLFRALQVREMSMMLLILVAGIIMSIASPYFLSLTNFIAIVRGFSTQGLVVVGMSLLLVAGVFDLSVGSVMALTGIITAWLIVDADVPYILAVVGGLSAGTFIGLINGTLVTWLKVNPLIATLGMMTVARGFALGLTEGSPVINVPRDFAWIGQGSIAGVPIPFIILVVIAFLMDLFLRRGRAARQLYYIGGNKEAARLSGMRVDRIMLTIFGASGFFSALAGIVSMARLTSGIPTAYAGAEMRVIAGCVIGGMSLSGGEGSVLGAMLGLVFMSLVSNAMTLFGMSVYWEGVVTGSILIAAVALDMLAHHRR